ncbi:TIGR03089 family protein [Kineosporia sp. NBRC 101731]|uniref:TIGR03089 family protein n=1 Tax=Kineosporia sp. NBRC 101731 TaxID=3032199 RepID=UPI0024A50C38|nr:TIGR03089 family protein [Kineosporia sp. NBRC 101731]GLY28462.1 acyl-CoA synthetase [Kineosporia sp. NBRC 101731]
MTTQAPADVAALLSSLMSTDPGRPRVTWYGPNSERVEFSAKTLGNWVAKTANLLVEELDCEPGSTVAIALPVHWRSVSWLLAAWAVGVHVVVFDENLGPARTDLSFDVLVTDRPSSPPVGSTQAALVVVALPSLATRWTGDVPPGAIDAASEIRLQPDAFNPYAAPTPDSPALTIGELTVSYGDLFTQARTAAGEVSTRLLTGAGPSRAVEAYLAPLVTGGSVVLHHDLTGLGTEEREHLEQQEQVTATDLGPAL